MKFPVIPLGKMYYSFGCKRDFLKTWHPHRELLSNRATVLNTHLCFSVNNEYGCVCMHKLLYVYLSMLMLTYILYIYIIYIGEGPVGRGRFEGVFAFWEALEKKKEENPALPVFQVVAFSFRSNSEWTQNKLGYAYVDTFCRHVNTKTQANHMFVIPFLFLSLSVAWLAFTVCMSAGVSTLNNYTKKVLMVGPRRTSGLNPCSFVGLLPPYYTPANPATALACPPSPPRISHLSPYYEPPSATLPASTPRLTHSHSLPLPHSDSFPPPPSHPAPASPFHRLSLPSPSPSPIPSVHVTLPRHQETHYEPEEDYSPLWTTAYVRTGAFLWLEDLCLSRQCSLFLMVLSCALNLHGVQRPNESNLLWS